MLVFNLGFDAKGPEMRNCWMYIPESKYCFYRVGFYSNIIPAERMSLYVELGYTRDAEIDEEAMLPKVLEDLKTAGVISNQRLVSHHSVVMNPAYVHITKQGIAETKRIKKELATQNVFTIGRYGSWNYSSI